MNTRRVNEHLHAPIPACEETNHVIHRQAILRCGHTSSRSLTPNILWLLLHLSLVNQTHIKCVLLLLKLSGGKSTKWNCDYGDFSNLRAVNCAGESRGEINSYVKPLTEFSSIYFNKRLKCFHKNMKKIIDRSATLLQVH